MHSTFAEDALSRIIYSDTLPESDNCDNRLAPTSVTRTGLAGAKSHNFGAYRFITRAFSV